MSKQSKKQCCLYGIFHSTYQLQKNHPFCLNFLFRIINFDGNDHPRQKQTKRQEKNLAFADF